MTTHPAGRGSSALRAVADEVSSWPLPVRWGLRAAVLVGFMGGVLGLVLGLVAHPPTAWFAAIEVGLPATVLGGVLGLLAGALVVGGRLLRRRDGRRPGTRP